MVDSHCHIAGPEFAADLAEVIDRAQLAGVTQALVILAADDEPEIAQGSKVAAQWPAVRFSVGVHPHAAGKFATHPADAAKATEAVIASGRGRWGKSDWITTTISRRGRCSRTSFESRSNWRDSGVFPS